MIYPAKSSLVTIPKVEIWQGHIPRRVLNLNPERVFIYPSAEYSRHGNSAAADLYGEFNSYAIPYRRINGRYNNPLWTDDTYITNVDKIDKAFNCIPRDKIWVIPSSCFRMPVAERVAPQTIGYLKIKIEKLKRGARIVRLSEWWATGKPQEKERL